MKKPVYIVTICSDSIDGVLVRKVQKQLRKLFGRKVVVVGLDANASLSVNQLP